MAPKRTLDPKRAMVSYGRWLAKQPLAERTRRAYEDQVNTTRTWAGLAIGRTALERCQIRLEAIGRFVTTSGF